MGRIIVILLFVLLSAAANAQDSWGHEYRGELPVYIDSLQSRLDYPLAYRNYIRLLGGVGDVDSTVMAPSTMRGLQQMAWKAAARMKIMECMGVRPPLPEDWDMRLLGEEQRDGYKAQKIEFALSRWYRVKAYLLVPDGNDNGNDNRNDNGNDNDNRNGNAGRMPAVVVMHDHGAHLTIGKEKVVRPFGVSPEVMADADAWVEQLYEGQYLGDYLARNGFVVLAIDMPLWGERGRAEGADRKKYDIIAGNMMMAGVNLCAFTHYDDLASIDFLASLPFVDADRIGVAGLSMGAYRSWMAAALSDKVRAVCAVCWMVSTDAQLTTKYGRKENGGFANTIPGLRNWLDYPDIASLVAPRRMLIVAGSEDKLFPLPGVEKSFGIMRDVWKAFDASDNLSAHILKQKHECTKENQRMILEFLKGMKEGL